MGARRDPRVKVGLCGFSMAMPAYPRHFPIVEVQQTFYQPPAPNTLRRWRELMPPGFEFTVKAWQLVTHAATSSTYRRLPAWVRHRRHPHVAGLGTRPLPTLPTAETDYPEDRPLWRPRPVATETRQAPPAPVSAPDSGGWDDNEPPF